MRQIRERNRLLEREAASRTAGPERRNEQLEGSGTIVQAINAQTSFRRLPRPLQDRARVIRGAEKAVARVRIEQDRA